MTPRLVIFDVDGTLVDGQAHIMDAMRPAFAAQGLSPPPLHAVLQIVGLSLPEAMAVLVPELPDPDRARLVQDYRDAFNAARISADPGARSPLFPGAREMLDALAARDDLILAIATGNSRRGLAHVLEINGLSDRFASTQTADDHPSKPHPGMIETCLAETGVDVADAVMVGDTSYDIQMAVAAGCPGLGVSWGYHATEALQAAGAANIYDSFDALTTRLLGQAP